MQKPSKRNHYIPRFFLSAFTPSETKEDFLWILDKNKVEQRQDLVKNIAYEKNLYTLDIPETKPDELESGFGQFEGLAANVFKELVHYQKLPSGENYVLLMNFFALLAVRTPSARETLSSPFKQMQKKRLKHNCFISG